MLRPIYFQENKTRYQLDRMGGPQSLSGGSEEGKLLPLPRIEALFPHHATCNPAISVSYVTALSVECSVEKWGDISMWNWQQFEGSGRGLLLLLLLLVGWG
jgi:hypothetical protein